MKDCNTENFREKSVVNSCDGKILGHVSEIVFDVCDGRITAIVISEESGLLSFKKCENILVPWDKIVKIGEDVIIVDAERCARPQKGKKDDCC